MSPPPPPPPPPLPPFCLPGFSSKRSKSTRVDGRPVPVPSLVESSVRTSTQSPQRSSSMRSGGSGSSSATLTTATEKLTFKTDTEGIYDVPPNPPQNAPQMTRSNSKKAWGYGWGSGKQDKDKERDREKEMMRERERSKPVMSRRNTADSAGSRVPPPMYQPPSRQSSKNSGSSGARRPRLAMNDSSSTLVGSALDRKVNFVESVKEKADTTARLEELRKLMQKDSLDYYVVPSEDAHGSEYVASSDRRREWISGFTGSAGQAVVSKTAAYLVTDSRYWLQAEEELDENWHLITAGAPDAPRDWIEWLMDRVNNSRIGIDARMISHEKAMQLNTRLAAKGSKLIYPPQNLVDLIWKDKPSRSKEPIFIQPIEFAGHDAHSKLAQLREWIQALPLSTSSFSRAAPTATQMHNGTLVASLANIAYILNLRGQDVPYNPVFQGYLYVGLDRAILFVESAKVDEEVGNYLKELGVERRDYNDIWTFLRKREWGEGKVIIPPQTSYAISLMLTHLRYTIAPSIVDQMKAVKNDTELEGLRRAYLRDGVAFVRWYAWLDQKLSQGYEITEWEAAWKLTEYRRRQKNFMGLAYENISATGPNAALPHYSPLRDTAKIIDRVTPYLNDSGGQYRDGTCDTTRTVHFGRPTPEQCEAYTRVLQGHIAIDSAIFPEGTSGKNLDVLARRALWQDGLNYMHGTGHGVGSYLNVHEGPHGFGIDVALQPGNVLTNEPGFYNPGQWGIRIESALVVRRCKTKREFNGDIWLGFERLTCVPIQTRMVKEDMLTKEEKQWLKDHNRTCYARLEPWLKDDPRALKWLKREAERGIGQARAFGSLAIDWD